MGAPERVTDKNINSAPAYANGMVWFQGDDNRLYRVSLDNPSDLENPNGIKCLSAPCAAPSAIYFQGEGNKLMMMQPTWPYLCTNLFELGCTATPVAPSDGFVYYLNGAVLARVNPYTPDSSHTLATNCSAPPAVSMENSKYLYFTDTSGNVSWIVLAKKAAHISAVRKINPYAVGTQILACCDGYAYFEYEKDLYRVQITKHLNADKPEIYVEKEYSRPNYRYDPGFDDDPLGRHIKGAATAFHFHMDGHLYFQDENNDLVSTKLWPPSETAVVTNSGKLASPPCAGPEGVLLYQGADKKLYMIKIS